MFSDCNKTVKFYVDSGVDAVVIVPAKNVKKLEHYNKFYSFRTSRETREIRDGLLRETMSAIGYRSIAINCYVNSTYDCLLLSQQPFVLFYFIYYWLLLWMWLV